MSRPYSILLTAIIITVTASIGHAQGENQPLRIFGYFQNTFQHQDVGGSEAYPSQNTFAIQQLNLFLQKPFTRHWSAFVNFEVINNFSARRNWGDFSIEEAWVKYRYDNRLNLKIGLQIPIFNHLNEIKNRTPLLPYIIRPIVYETSLAEIVAIEHVVPSRAYFQAYGFLPYGRLKLDYAAYIGNSTNINSDSELGQTGLDSTNSVLVGGRIGLRVGELKAGVSVTYDELNIPIENPDSTRDAIRVLGNVGRVRFGMDLLYRLGPVSFEGEYIRVGFESVNPGLEENLSFLYGTLGVQATEKLFVYGSYWVNNEDVSTFLTDLQVPPDIALLPVTDLTANYELRIPTGGAAYHIDDRITIKAQVAFVEQELEFLGQTNDWSSNFYSLGVSVFF